MTCVIVILHSCSRSAEVGGSAIMLLLCEHEVNDPTTAEVRLRRSTMGSDLRVLTPGVFQCVRQDRQPLEVAILIDAAGEGNDSPRQPPRLDYRQPERVAEDTPDQGALA